MYCFTFLNTVDDEVKEHLEKAKAEKVIEEVVRNFKETDMTEWPIHFEKNSYYCQKHRHQTFFNHKLC